MSSPTPLALPNLSLILSSLLPPSFPLPAHCLSSALKTRQLYLPPSADDLYDDAWVCQRPEQASGSGLEGEGDGLKVGRVTGRLIQLERELREVEDRENARDVVQGEGGPILDYEKLARSVEYSVKDEETILARVIVSSTAVTGPISSGDGIGVEITFIYEPTPEDAPNSPWKLFDTSLSTSNSTSSGWYSSLPAAQSAAGHPSSSFSDPRQPQTQAQASTPGETTGEGDFWAGYDSPDEDQVQIPALAQAPAQAQARIPNPSSTSDSTQTQPQPPSALNLSVPRLPTPTTQDPSISTGEDDSYWSAYAAVEDGLRASNPPSTSVSRFTTPLYHQQYQYGDDSGGKGVGMPGVGGSASRKGSYFGVGAGRSAIGGLSRVRTGDSGMGGGSGGGGGGGGEYWGTGGETPVGWSPPVQQSQLPPIHSSYSDQLHNGDGSAIDLTKDEMTPPVDNGIPSASASTGLQPGELQAALEGLSATNTSAGEAVINKALPTPPEPSITATARDNDHNNINGPAPLSSAAGEKDMTGRREALRATLKGLRGMWMGVGGGGDEEDWREVLREFL